MANYIVSGCRTPVGKYLGALAEIPAPRLAALAIGEAITRAGIAPGQVGEVILGNVVSAGLGQAPARQAALAAGLPPAVTALTINMVCGSGLKAVMLGDQALREGETDFVVAGGMESMSQAPHLIPAARRGLAFGHQRLVDSLLHDGLWCASERTSMGEIAERLAAACGITRSAQDDFAVASHRRAVQAQRDGKFTAEIVPLEVPQKKGTLRVEHDEGPRADTNFETLARLPSSFSPQGSVTAGNSSQLSDGAAAVVLASEQAARTLASPWKARLVASAAAGVPPGELFVAPVEAVRRALAKARLSPADIDLWEVNEAFAVQCLVCQARLDIDPERLNVHGGAIALGHPLGASGARVLVTLLHALVQRQLRRGVAALCLGGGNAVAMVIERV